MQIRGLKILSFFPGSMCCQRPALGQVGEQKKGGDIR